MEPTFINDQLEDMFAKRGVEVMKQPINLQYDTAHEDGVCETKEGKVAYKSGDAIMTGTEGEQWPIAADTFAKTYDITGDGLAAKKAIPVLAVRLEEAATVKASWGDLKAKPGDFVVQYAKGDYGVVSQEIFNKTYRLATPDKEINTKSGSPLARDSAPALYSFAEDTKPVWMDPDVHVRSTLGAIKRAPVSSAQNITGADMEKLSDVAKRGPSTFKP